MPRGPESECSGTMRLLKKNYHLLRLHARRTMTSTSSELEMLGKEEWLEEECLGEDEGWMCALPVHGLNNLSQSM